MFVRIFFFCFGFMLCLIGLFFDICYLNLFMVGYNFFDYVKFIFSRIECVMFFFGLFFIIFSCFLKGDNNELHL